MQMFNTIFREKLYSTSDHLESMSIMKGVDFMPEYIVLRFVMAGVLIGISALLINTWKAVGWVWRHIV